LDGAIWLFVPLHELRQEIRGITVLIGTALAQLARNVFGNVTGPSLSRVETDYADRVAEWAFEQTADNGFEVGLSDISFAPSPSVPAVVLEDQIDISIDVRNDRW
jgi:hypothetical protein